MRKHGSPARPSIDIEHTPRFIDPRPENRRNARDSFRTSMNRATLAAIMMSICRRSLPVQTTAPAVDYYDAPQIGGLGSNN